MSPCESQRMHSCIPLRGTKLTDHHHHSTLSSHALDALKDFYADRDARAKQFEQLKAVSEEEASGRAQQPLSMDAFTEDWNESQFWVRHLLMKKYSGAVG